jgi:hypothetical protein
MSIPRDENPFAPPRAAVLEAERPEGDLFIPEGRRVETSRGIAWFGEAWQVFKSSPGMWVALFVVFFLLSLVLAIIPLGSIVSSLCFPAVIGGVMLGCRTLEEGGNLRVAHLFAGFSKHAGPLLLLGVLNMVGMMVVGFIAGVGMALMIPLGLFNAGDLSSLMGVAPWVLLVVLVALALMMPLIMAMWFAPALVVFHEVAPIAAMRSSFQGCLRNLVPFIAYGVVSLLLLIVALIPLGLGLLVDVPVIWITAYVGYRDIFLRPA